MNNVFPISNGDKKENRKKNSNFRKDDFDSTELISHNVKHKEGRGVIKKDKNKTSFI